MKEEYSKTLTSPSGRALTYLGIFAIVSALYELLSRITNSPIQSNASILLTLFTLGGFMLLGAVFASQPRMVSRVTSAATLLILGVIALKMGRTVVPDPYLFALAFCIAILGAQTVFHRKLASSKKAIMYSFIIGCVALATVISFAYGVTIVDRIVTQQQYNSSVKVEN